MQPSYYPEMGEQAQAQRATGSRLHSTTGEVGHSCLYRLPAAQPLLALYPLPCSLYEVSSFLSGSVYLQTLV